MMSGVCDHGDGYCDVEVGVGGKVYRVYFRKKTEVVPDKSVCRHCEKESGETLKVYSVGTLDYVQDGGYNRLDPASTVAKLAVEEVNKLLTVDSRICRYCLVAFLKEFEAKL